jgi:hypothetical protein
MATQYIKKGSAPRPADGGVGIAVNSSNELEIRQIISGVDTVRKIPVGVSGGAVAVATAAVTGEKIGAVRQTTIALSALPVTVRNTEQGGGIKFFDFAAGRLLILGVVAKDIVITTTSAIASTLKSGVTGNFGVGSTTQANGTLATTEQNIVPTTNFTSSTTINVAPAAVDSALASSLQLDGTGTAVDLFFNVGVATGTDIDGDATVTVSGTLIITWIDLGND